MDTRQKEKDFFGLQAKKYASKLIENYNFIRVLGMSEPVPLTSLYIRVDVLEEVTAFKRADLKDLESKFDFVHRSFGKKRETKEAIEVVNDIQKFILLGKPGAGKTTFLKYLAIASLNEEVKIKDRKLPVFVSLKEYSEKGMDLMTFIAHQFDICGLPEADSFIEQLLSNGKCLLLLDGLDEVSESNLDRVIGEIKDVTKKYSNNQFIVSCRVAAYNHYFPQFSDIEVADFNDEQIERFINRWFKKDKETGQECLKQIKDSKPLKEMAQVPLLLTLLCIEFDENYGFPPSRSELYESAINTLLKKWDSSRRIKRDTAYKELSVKRKVSMLSEIAYNNFKGNKYFFKERDLCSQIEKYIEKLNFIDSDVIGIDILNEITSQHAIFVPRAKRIYSFAHLSFQEYFTAIYIVNRNEIVSEIVRRFSLKDNWREVFLLLTEMSENADNIILSLIKRSFDMINKSSDLRLFIKETNSYLFDVKVKYTESIRRVACVYSTLVKRRFNSLSYKISKISKNIFMGYNKISNLYSRYEIINLSLSPRELSYIFKFKYTSYKALPPRLIKEITDLLNLYILTLDCLNTKCVVSPEVRERVLNSILLVEDDK